MKTKISAFFLCALTVLSGCSSIQNASNKAKGGTIGGVSGAAIGAIIGAIAGKGKGAAIGGAVGAAVGGGAGVLIGHKMDKAKKAAEAANAEAQILTDSTTGLQYVRATFSSGLLFGTGQATLSDAAAADLANLAASLDKDLALTVYGYTDNQGWKNCTAAQSQAKNEALSLQRANAVKNCLVNNGVISNRFQDVKGFGEANPIADNSTKAGQEQNRRVEVYIIPSQETIDQAKAQADK